MEYLFFSLSRQAIIVFLQRISVESNLKYGTGDGQFNIHVVNIASF